MPKISIIVPIYNTENYLPRCLDTLINQTLKDIEIICINDGSTDGSLKILEEYKAKDSRIILLTQKNKGVSSARNYAIEHVTGEYLMFVDSDDWLELNACDILYKTIVERKSQILFFDYYYYTQRSTRRNAIVFDFIKNIGNNNAIFFENYELLIKIPLLAAGKLYQTNLIKNNNIKFPKQIPYGEDKVFSISAITKAEAISAIEDCLYYYRKDSEESLCKTPGNYKYLLVVMNLIKKIINTSKKIPQEDKEKICCLFYDKYIAEFLWQWGCIHNLSLQAKCYGYLLKLKRNCRYFSKLNIKKYIPEYRRLNEIINDYKNLFIKKLFEPLIEIEFRRNRFVLYLFEKQVLNFSTILLEIAIFKLKYLKNIIKLRLFAKKRKIKVGIWITEFQKLNFRGLYHALEKDSHFEPVILLSYFRRHFGDKSPLDHINKNIEFLKANNMKYELVYNTSEKEHIPLKFFKPDIVFYQQPWAIHKDQNITTTSWTALTCYIPYCFYSIKSHLNYMQGFHKCVWRYFVETDMHKKEYEELFDAKNCIALGSAKLDNYKFLDDSKMKTMWKTNKKRIIYAPHHSFEDSVHELATFRKNSTFILDMAKKYSDTTEWVFKPHPMFISEVIRNNVMTHLEIEEYYKEWEKVGTVYTDADYYELFVGSDCLITDCISFLAEYAPTGKPVLHLRKDKQKEEFNTLLTKITDDYYKIYDNETLEKTFVDVILNGNDYMKERRIDNIKYLMIDKNKTTGEKIVEYLKEQLHIKD